MHFIPTEGFPSHAWVSLELHSGHVAMVMSSCSFTREQKPAVNQGFIENNVFRGTCSRRSSAQSNSGWVRDYTTRTPDWPINTLAAIKVINKLWGMERQMATQFGRALVLGFHSCRHSVELAELSAAVSSKHLGKPIHIALIYSGCHRCDSRFKYLISSSLSSAASLTSGSVGTE